MIYTAIMFLAHNSNTWNAYRAILIFLIFHLKHKERLNIHSQIISIEDKESSYLNILSFWQRKKAIYQQIPK